MLPALPMQESLLSETMQSPTAYWSTSIYALGHETNVDLLATAWTQIIRSTEALRTAFIPTAILASPSPTNATFLQIIYKEPRISLNANNLETTGDLQSNIGEESYRVAERSHAEYFTEPPWAVWVIRQGANRYMAVCTHHSLRDELSIEILMDDLEKTYLNPSDQGSFSRRQISNAVSVLTATEEQYAENEQFWKAELSVNEHEDATNTWPNLHIEGRSTESKTISHRISSSVSYSRLATLTRGYRRNLCSVGPTPGMGSSFSSVPRSRHGRFRRDDLPSQPIINIK